MKQYERIKMGKGQRRKERMSEGMKMEGENEGRNEDGKRE